jgi:phospholipase/carboxylesterase
MGKEVVPMPKGELSRLQTATASAIGLVCCLLATAAIAAGTEQLDEMALEAMQEGNYEKASRFLEKLLRQQPGDPRALYNLACCLSRMGETELAAERLEEAWQAGLRDPGLIRTDPDLAALRETREGSALIDRLASAEERLIRLRGTPHFFDTSVLGGLRVVAPLQLEEGREYPLVIILHGHGANPENYAGLFELVDTPLEAIVCAPYGPYPIFSERGRGYSWYPEPGLFREVLARGGAPEDRARRREEIESREQRVSESYVLSAIEAVKAQYPVDSNRVYVMGHSEGGVLAYGVAIKNPDTVRGLIVVGARLRDRDASSELLTGASGKLQALICHSREDEAIEFGSAKAAHETLQTAGIQSELVPYSGGHAITTELARTIALWIAHHDRLEEPRGGN